MKRVRVAGAGVISPWGVGGSALTEPPARAHHAVGALRVQADLAALTDSSRPYQDRASELLLAAVALARQEAEWDLLSPEEVARTGIAVGAANGCLDSMVRFWESVAQKGPRLANAIYFSHSYPNTPASLECIDHGWTGLHLTFCQGRASGALAVLAAFDALQENHADRMIAAAVDAIPPGLPENHPSLEGGAAFALEPAGSGAGPCITGCGSTSFLPSLPGHLPDAEAIQQAIAGAMAQAAGSPPSRISRVFAGSNFPQAEAAAVRNLFGSDVRLTTPPYAGNSGAASVSFCFGLAEAINGLQSGESETTAILVNSVDAGGCCVSVCLAPG